MSHDQAPRGDASRSTWPFALFLVGGAALVLLVVAIVVLRTSSPAPPPPWHRERLFVVGGTSGIGAAMAQRVRAQPGPVLVGVSGLHAGDVQGDLCEPAVRAKVVTACVQGAATTVVLSAAQTRVGLVRDEDDEDGEHGDCTALQALNGHAIVALHRALRRALPRCRLVVLSSQLGDMAAPWQACYGATKAFLSAYFRSLRAEEEASADGSRTTLVVLGGVRTDMSTWMRPSDAARVCMTADEAAAEILGRYHTEAEMCVPRSLAAARAALALLPAAAVGRATERVFARLHARGRPPLRVAVVGNGNIGTFLVDALSRRGGGGDDHVQWFARRARNPTPHMMTSAAAAAGTAAFSMPRQQPLQALPACAADVILVTVPPHAIRRLPLPDDQTPVVLLSTTHHARATTPPLPPPPHGGRQRPLVWISMPFMCAAAAPAAAVSCTGFGQAVLVQEVPEHPSLAADVAAAFTSGGLAARVTQDIDADLGVMPLVLTQLAEGLRRRGWRADALTGQDFTDMAAQVQRVTGVWAGWLHVLRPLAAARLWPFPFFEQHYRRLHEQRQPSAAAAAGERGGPRAVLARAPKILLAP